MIFADVLRELRKYDEGPFDWQEPAIYVASPFNPNSEAIVEWSMPKGGLPPEAAKRLLYYVASVREALALLEKEYDSFRDKARVEELCSLLVQRVDEQNERRAIARKSDF